MKVVFLDRDGVINSPFIINGKPHPPASLNELTIIDGVDLAIKKFRENNFKIIVITNQPDVARGVTKKEVVLSINKYLMDNLDIDNIFTCFHDDCDGCDCRKPKPGLIHKASTLYNINFKSSFLVGDRFSDIQLGVSVGLKTVFLDYNYNEPRPTNFDFSANKLIEAVNFIIGD